MKKIKASVVVIGFGEEDHRMYPHLYDFLKNLRSAFDDVVYINFADKMGISRDYHFCYIYKARTDIIEHLKSCSLNSLNLRWLKTLCRRLISFPLRTVSYYRQRNRLIKNLKGVKMKYNKGFILAIDQTAAHFAEKYFPGKVVLWSCDILAKDDSWRSTENVTWKNRYDAHDRILTFNSILKAKALIIQDENRKKLLEDLVGGKFSNIIYLPIGLNDSEFCRNAAEMRRGKTSFSTVNIIQNGRIAEIRWSDQLIDAYQNWPMSYNLYLHGFLGYGIDNKILKAWRKPAISTYFYDHDKLTQILNDYDIGFVAYKEYDANHYFIENSSAQMVEFLRLGIPIIGYGSPLFNDFVNNNTIGIGISAIEEIKDAIKKIIDNYSIFSYNARKLFEERFNLNNIFNNYLIKSLEELCMEKS